MERAVKRYKASISVFAMLLILFASVSTAGENSFRKEFINNYLTNRFKEQVELVKKNKDIIPREVRALIADALAEQRTFEQKMYLLNIAQAMASMHKYWNKDEGPLHEVETALKMEIAKEKKRKAEAEKWARYEKFLGNFLMREHGVQMEAAGVAPVIYPHWIHRLWYSCKVCHDYIFKMKRGANDISHRHTDRGSQCGACHNDTMAFGTDNPDSCERCHIAGRPEVMKLYSVKDVDQERIKELAQKVGAKWRPEKLPGGRIPVDRFGFIDWLELKRRGVFEPVASLRKDFEDKVRNNTILFKTRSPVLNDTLFDHKIHSTWINCSSCHPSIFKEELGADKIRMKDMASGKYCGYCHGKVSFSFADCLRCHNHPKDEPPGDALARPPM